MSQFPSGGSSGSVPQPVKLPSSAPPLGGVVPGSQPSGPQPVARAPASGGSPSGLPTTSGTGSGSGIQPSSKIRTFDQKLMGVRHEDNWQRSPNANGTGAIHVKSFHCKLTDEALHYLDQQINEWLDAHPQYEVKFVTTSVGEWTGKLKEPNLVMQVWV